MKINTGIRANDKFMSILSSVIGQLSDGIWEDSRAMQKYWKSLVVRITEDGYIELEDKYNVCGNVMEFFANKIKQIIKIEIDDGNSELEWDRSCSAQPRYMHDHVTVGDCYKLYELLKGRNTTNRSYSSIETYNVILTYEDTTIHMQIEAANEREAKSKAIELLTSNIRARAELA